MNNTISRRAILAAASVAAAVPAIAASGRIRLGGPIFLHSDDPDQLAREHRRLGYGAAYCPAVELKDTARIEAIRSAFARNDVVISEVGAWKNMLDPDAEKRRANLAYVTERCALAEAVGARCCVDIAGSRDPNIWYAPNPANLSREFFDATVENCRKIIDAVKPKRTRFTIEMMGWSVPDGPDSYVELIHAVDRAAFGVHLDVCNGVNCPRLFYGNGEFIGECFRKLGPWIVSCHAKDLAWIVELNVHFQETIPGRGKIDYTRYLTELARLDHEAPLMLEHLKNAAEYDEGREYIRRTGAAAGIEFA